MRDETINRTNINNPEVLASLVRLVADRAAHPLEHKSKICFLLGAGADISSGGLTFVQLKRAALEEFAKRPLFDITPAEEIETQFEELFGELAVDERALLIEFLFRKTESLQPSDGYKLLVLLAEVGGIDAVITTNFDLMLERSQTELGRDPFQVFAPGFARPYPLTLDRFELVKKPYLKLHGDLGSRSVVLLTPKELERSEYDSSMLQLVRSILQTHDLVIVGYSGFDAALGQVIADGLGGTTNRIFWCNPDPPSQESPLYSQISHRVRAISINFDDLMMAVARPVLERPSLATTEPTYLRCLFDWRVDYCNTEYIQTYGERSGKSRVDLFARRPGIEDRLASFLRSDKPLAIIAGPSGFGKTTVGIRLHKTWRNQALTKILLVRSTSLPASGDLEQLIAEQVGGLGPRAPFSLFRLERWLKTNDLRLVLFLDGINEFSAELTRCVQLFRNIVRLCYFLPEASSIRVITTIRQETWNAMLPNLDVGQLSKALWVDGDSRRSISVIACGEFSDQELSDALSRLHEYGYASIDTANLSPSVINQLRDPYLMSVIAESARQGLPPIPGAGAYQRAFQAKLQRRGSFIDVATLTDILADIAIRCLASQQDHFRETDIEPAQLRGEVVRLLKDLHVFVDAVDGFLQFEHDRTLEYFIALGLATGAGPSLETIQDLLHFLSHFKSQGKPIAAARLYFQMMPDRFSLIAAALRMLDDANDEHYGIADRELLFGFAREVVFEMAELSDPIAYQYVSDTIKAARAGTVGSNQLRSVVQAAASLSMESAIPLLSRVSHGRPSLASTEADIYANDKLVKEYLRNRCNPIDLLHEEPYRMFFGDPKISSWQRMGRLLGFAAELGPDNTHPEEYENVVHALGVAMDEITRECPWSSADSQALCTFILDNCDRLLFNATPQGINRFFGNPRRADFDAILDRLTGGGVLSEEDLIVFEPYIQSLTSDIEYHLSHALFVLSSFNDLERTLKFAEERFRSFSDKTAPEEIDFFDAVLVYLHVLHDIPYDEKRFGWWEETILRDWPDTLLHRPGLERGERRGFHDIFDRVFEDGFGVIYPYGVLSPSLRRKRTHYAQYRTELAGETSIQLPLYTKYLKRFLDANRIEEALQVLHAIGSVISAWPIEGLLTLREVIGYPEPRIRRATIRLLAEAFNRHPFETLSFLKTSGAAVTDEDLIHIKIRQDARIGRGQTSEEEWARIGHFLFQRTGAKEAFVSCLRALLRAPSFDQAVINILHELKLTD